MNDPTQTQQPAQAQPVSQPAPLAPQQAAQGPAGAPVRPRLIPGSDATEGSAPASPEDENVLHQVVAKAMMMIHGTKSRQAVVKALHNPREEVASVVGRTAANILMEISKQKQAVTKEPVPEDILQEAAGYVIPELITVGVAARIFPFDDHEGNGDSVGTGATKFDEIAKMAMLEATKVYGEAQLRAPGAEAKTEQAGNDWAGEVSREVQNGTASPDYMKLARPTQLIQEGK